MKAMHDIRMAWRVDGARTWLAKPRRVDSRAARAEGAVLGPVEVAYLHKVARRLPKRAQEVMSGGMRTQATRRARGV
eukprot:3453266-Alexandrium_andersonii.AAC.1